MAFVPQPDPVTVVPQPITTRDIIAYLLGLGTGVGVMLLVGRKDDDDQTVIVVQGQQQ